jgi:hypothetical protein
VQGSIQIIQDDEEVQIEGVEVDFSPKRAKYR